MLLPTPINRVRLRSFWALLSLTGALVLAVGLWLLDGVATAPKLATWLVLTAVLAAPGLLRPYSVHMVYRGWNQAARSVARLVERYVTALCFFTVMLAMAVGSPVGRFERTPTSSSMWRSRGSQGRDSYPSQDNVPVDNDPGAGANKALSHWRRSTGRRSAVVLAPFVGLLQLTDVDGYDQGHAQTSIYTLY